MRALTFYTNPQSRGRIVHWMLEELSEPYDTVWIEYGSGSKSAEYLAINPMGKIPSLKHNGVVVTETPAICTYLAVAYPEKNLIPAAHDPRLANFFRWMFFAAGPVEASVTAKAMDWKVPEGRERTVGFGSHEEVLAALEIAVKPGPFICGHAFTAVDVYLGSHLIWGMQFGGIEKRSSYQDYVARLTTRPAYRRALEINEAKLAGK
ncbi:MAG: glutathione S-transferase family protein [Pseudohongiellaceae bacterium]